MDYDIMPEFPGAAYDAWKTHDPRDDEPEDPPSSDEDDYPGEDDEGDDLDCLD